MNLHLTHADVKETCVRIQQLEATPTCDETFGLQLLILLLSLFSTLFLGKHFSKSKSHNCS